MSELLLLLLVVVLQTPRLAQSLDCFLSFYIFPPPSLAAPENAGFRSLVGAAEPVRAYGIDLRCDRALHANATSRSPLVLREVRRTETGVLSVASQLLRCAACRMPRQIDGSRCELGWQDPYHGAQPSCNGLQLDREEASNQTKPAQILKTVSMALVNVTGAARLGMFGVEWLHTAPRGGTQSLRRPGSPGSF
ncbi:hypothetical protein GQ53DRAFT_771263 [Thozetella sp. PMI_491]|nr:hypothetical protein GQ53DRAFT_771263 [Thozetella sp. PMI_491]